MNTYIVTSQSNYDTMVHIVNASTETEAIKVAMDHPECGAWEDCEAHKLNTTMHGVVFWE